MSWILTSGVFLSIHTLLQDVHVLSEEYHSLEKIQGGRGNQGGLGFMYVLWCITGVRVFHVGSSDMTMGVRHLFESKGWDNKKIMEFDRGGCFLRHAVRRDLG